MAKTRRKKKPEPICIIGPTDDFDVVAVREC